MISYKGVESWLTGFSHSLQRKREFIAVFTETSDSVTSVQGSQDWVAVHCTVVVQWSIDENWEENRRCPTLSQTKIEGNVDERVPPCDNLKHIISALTRRFSRTKENSRTPAMRWHKCWWKRRCSLWTRSILKLVYNEAGGKGDAPIELSWYRT
jgi:hypothetical protein